MPVISLRVLIVRAEGTFVGRCERLGLSTCGASVDEVGRRAVDMIKGYFTACRKVGTYEKVISDLVGRPADSATVTLKTEFSAEQELSV